MMKNSSPPYSVALTCHPEAYSQFVGGVEARVAWQGRAIVLTYALEGDVTCLRIPPPRTPSRADRLWEHTCFEAFIRVKSDPAYHEFNFAPSGEWAAYTFRSYREGAPLGHQALDPGITVRSANDSFQLDAVIRLDYLPAIQSGARLRLGLSAVVEDDRGVLSHWALRHPPGKPDFHHPDAFALELEPLVCRTAGGPSTNRS